jgi:hypothetical protein
MTILKSAREPTLMQGKRGGEWRTHEQWVELEEENGKYTVSWGNDRGISGSQDCASDLGRAESEYEHHLTDDMEDEVTGED